MTDSPTGRQPSEPEMQRIVVLSGADGAAVAAIRDQILAIDHATRVVTGTDFSSLGSDFEDIEARAMAAFSADHPDVQDLLNSEIVGRRYSPAPALASGNRHERRAQAARNRR